MSLAGVPARGEGLLNGGAACYQIYQTADGRFVTLGALEDKFWAAFCRAVDREKWIPRHGELLPQTALIGEVAELMQTRSRDVWVRDLAGVDCCFEPVLEPDEVAADPQVRYRGLVTQSIGTDPVIEVLYPARFDGARPARRQLLKEVNAETILRAWSNR